MTTLARTNREAFGKFLDWPSPWILYAAIVASINFAIFVFIRYDWTWWALLGPAIVIVMQPFLEWVLHIIVLHDKPRKVGPWTFDTVVAKDHRIHHLDPREMKYIFIPTRWVFYLITTVALIAVFNWIHFGPAVSATVAVTQSIMALVYEWTHFWIHQDVPAQNRYAKLVKRNHRNHHYRNSTYWLGVTSDVGDRVFRTAPDPKTVEVVEYAKDLLKVPNG